MKTYARYEVTPANYAGYHQCSLSTARRHLRMATVAFPEAVLRKLNWGKREIGKPPRWWTVYVLDLVQLKSIVRMPGWKKETWIVMNLIELIEETCNG